MKYYTIRTSRGDITIESGEVQKLIEGLKSGQIVIFKQGIFNPPFFVNLVEDEKKNKAVEKILADYKFQIETYPEEKIEKPNPRLKNIFEGLSIK